MKLDLNTLQAFIIFAYKYERYQLVEELLKLVWLFENGEAYSVAKKASEWNERPGFSQDERPRIVDEQMSSYWLGEEYQVVKRPELKLIQGGPELRLELRID